MTRTTALRRALLAATMLAALSACSLIPDMETPAPPVAQSWPEGAAYAPQAAEPGGKTLADLGWDEVFRNRTLRGLIATALETNRDLRVAALNVEAARAAYGVSRADLLPSVDANGARSRSRTPPELSSSGRAVTSTAYTANLGVTAFELDFFGRVRSLNAQALETFLATQEAQTGARIALIAEVANAWLSLQADRRQLRLTEETLETRQTSQALIDAKFENGVATELDVAQARTSLETARVNLASYTRAVAQDRNALELLVGRPLAAAEIADDGDDLSALVALPPAGLSSAVLLRRPDIREAEHALKAANAYIGAARAAFFPTISLTGSAGFGSARLGSLFEGASRAWTFAPSVSAPIFDAGRNFANLDAAKAQRDIAVASYEKAIQSAFREVADGLAARKTLVEQIAAQKALVAASEKSFFLSQARYDRGVSSYLEVLDAQRSLYAAQQTQIGLELTQLSNLVTLYKSLGGGPPPQS
ncbi:MAG: efflux transporter outer membrane subunit [Rhodospirillaceae bacterium]